MQRENRDKAISRSEYRQTEGIVPLLDSQPTPSNTHRKVVEYRDGEEERTTPRDLRVGVQADHTQKDNLVSSECGEEFQGRLESSKWSSEFHWAFLRKQKNHVCQTGQTSTPTNCRNKPISSGDFVKHKQNFYQLYEKHYRCITKTFVKHFSIFPKATCILNHWTHYKLQTVNTDVGKMFKLFKKKKKRWRCCGGVGVKHSVHDVAVTGSSPSLMTVAACLSCLSLPTFLCNHPQIDH